MKRRLVLVATAFALAASAYAQVVEGLDGRWEGYSIETPRGSRLLLVIKVESTGGATTASADSPEQGTFGLPMTVKREGDAVTFTIAPELYFAGKLSAERDTLTGEFIGPGANIAVTLKRTQQ